MSTRERWIVYPLIFLSLGIALRNQFLPTRRFGAVDVKAAEVSAQRVLCNDLVVLHGGECKGLKCDRFQFNEALGKHLRMAGLAECVRFQAGQADCKRMTISDSDGKPVVIAGADQHTQDGVIQTMNANGMPLVQIRATDAGGIVTAIGHGGKVLVAMGHEGKTFGVFGQFPQVGPPFPLTTPWGLGTKPSAIKPPGTVAPNVSPKEEEKPANSGQKP
ncbi:MAG: hypothetical protein ACWGMZ_00590 [Thermoguttaceae bacterium]